MTKPRYVFVNDQGDVFTTSNEPTAGDFGYAEVGMLIIVRLADCHFYGRTGQWQRIADGRLTTVEIDGEISPAFHAMRPEATFLERTEPAIEEIGQLIPMNSGRQVSRSDPTDAGGRRFTAS